MKIISGDFHWDFDLPLHLSDVVAIFAPVALWTRKPLLVEVLYFWALTASLQAVITPDLHETVPSSSSSPTSRRIAVRSSPRACSCSGCARRRGPERFAARSS